MSFGVLAPTSGAHEQRGRDLVDGAKAAIAEINIRGGVNGHKAALVTYDDGCDAKTARERALAIKASEVAGALGGICASAAGAAARTLGEDLPFLVTSANAPSIVSARHTPTAFLTNGTPYQSALATSHWLVYQRAQKLAVVTEDDKASKFLGQQVIKLSSPVPKLLSKQAVPADTTDWGATAKAALAGGPDIVYWAGSAAGGGALVAALREAGYDGKFVATAESESAGVPLGGRRRGRGRVRDRAGEPAVPSRGSRVGEALRGAVQARARLRRAAGLRGRARARAGGHADREGRPDEQQPRARRSSTAPTRRCSATRACRSRRTTRSSSTTTSR